MPERPFNHHIGIGFIDNPLHAIKFKIGNEIRDTWEDWRLVATSRPLVNPPKRKECVVDIPAADGSLDLSDVVAGRPTFQNRTGDIEFIVQNGFKHWFDLYTEIMTFLQARHGQMILLDEPEYFYEGVFSVSSWKSEKVRSKIVIDYDVYPYKKLVADPTNTEGWRL